MTDQAAHRAFAAQFFNECWGLLEKSGRTAQEDAQMVHLAHASRLHWQFAGSEREWAIGEWQISRVYAEVGWAEAALVHARAALALAGEAQLGPFLAASSHEGMARALEAVGRKDEAARHRQTALAWLERIEDQEDRAVVLADLEHGSAQPSS